MIDSRQSVCGKKSQGNAWMATYGLDHAWPVAAVAMVTVARTWTHKKGGLSRRDKKLAAAHAEACAKPNHEQEHQGQFCDSSNHDAIDLNLDFGPMQLAIKDFSNKISAYRLVMRNPEPQRPSRLLAFYHRDTRCSCRRASAGQSLSPRRRSPE